MLLTKRLTRCQTGEERLTTPDRIHVCVRVQVWRLLTRREREAGKAGERETGDESNRQRLHRLRQLLLSSSSPVWLLCASRRRRVCQTSLSPSSLSGALCPAPAHSSLLRPLLRLSSTRNGSFFFVVVVLVISSRSSAGGPVSRSSPTVTLSFRRLRFFTAFLLPSPSNECTGDACRPTDCPSL